MPPGCQRYSCAKIELLTHMHVHICTQAAARGLAARRELLQLRVHKAAVSIQVGGQVAG